MLPYFMLLEWHLKVFYVIILTIITLYLYIIYLFIYLSQMCLCFVVLSVCRCPMVAARSQVSAVSCTCVFPPEGGKWRVLDSLTS